MPGRPQEYRSDQLVVTFDPRYCIHTGRCLRALPEVFDVNRRPWIALSAADIEAVMETVAGCPSGALRYQRLDGGPREAPVQPTEVSPVTDGPLYVRGDLEIRDRAGVVTWQGTRMALCRCGASGNKPFCDNSHRESGFRSGH